jgi:hypothetical protein
MLLASAILSSIGGFAILVGAWIQARHSFEEHRLGHPIRYEGGPLDFWPSIRMSSFSGENGWTFIFVGGALVFVGSVIAAIAAA